MRSERLRALTFLSGSLLAAAIAHGQSPMPFDAGPVEAAKAIHSLRELRDTRVVKQQLDYSCGAAALATLLQFYFRDPVPEKQLLLEMLNALSPSERTDRVARGFTLLDLKNAALRHGFLAEGAVIPLTSLPQLSGPVIVYLVKDGARHFVVLRGVKEDRVYLADPDRGNICLDVRRFALQWPGIVLALGREGKEPPANHDLAVPQKGLARPELFTAREALFP